MELDGIEVEGVRYEHTAEAEAGIYMGTGERWWGSRIRYRRIGIADKRWTKILLVDVHPFDFEKVKEAVTLHITKGSTLP